MTELKLNDRDPHEILANILDYYDMKQSEYAELVGVTRSAVNEVITGRKNLSVNEWRRWFGVFAFKLEFNLLPSGMSQGFFSSAEDMWDWVQKRAQRRRMETPTRTAQDMNELAALLGVLGNYSTLLPDHLAPIFDSGWLYSQGSMATMEITSEIRQRMSASHRYDRAVQAARAEQNARADASD